MVGSMGASTNGDAPIPGIVHKRKIHQWMIWEYHPFQPPYSGTLFCCPQGIGTGDPSSNWKISFLARISGCQRSHFVRAFIATCQRQRRSSYRFIEYTILWASASITSQLFAYMPRCAPDFGVNLFWCRMMQGTPEKAFMLYAIRITRICN